MRTLVQVLDSGAETTSQPAHVGCMRQVHCYDQTKSHTQNVFVVASTHAVSNEGLVTIISDHRFGRKKLYSCGYARIDPKNCPPNLTSHVFKVSSKPNTTLKSGTVGKCSSNVLQFWHKPSFL